MKYEIKHINGTVLYTAEIADDTPSIGMVRAALKVAVRAGADLYGANLIGAYLFGANLSGANLYGADLRGANLRDADLRGANLRGSNLYGAGLRDADLSGANLYGADLRVSYLRGSNLYDADLRGSDLRDTNLNGANLNGADLYGAKITNSATLVGDRPILTIGPIGSRVDTLMAFCTDEGILIRAGCFTGTRDEFAQAVRDTHGDNEHAQEYQVALALIDAHAQLWCQPAATQERNDG